MLGIQSFIQAKHQPILGSGKPPKQAGSEQKEDENFWRVLVKAMGSRIRDSGLRLRA